jgi:hypothetical protein
MAKNSRKKEETPALEDRFVFVGDAIAPGDRSALKSALFEVEDRSTGASRCLKLWQKTGTPADEDLRRLWLHEMRQVQRVMAYVGAKDVIVDVLEFVEDADNFGVLLERTSAPLSVRRQRAGRSHWLQNLAASRPRTLFWRNIRRIATALGIVHAQGLVHGKLAADVIMTDASDEPDFQLSGFEWSLWVSADTADKSHAALSTESSAHRSMTYSFAEDWHALGTLVAECFHVKVRRSGDMRSAGDENHPIILSVSERALLKRLVMPTRLDYLDSVSITRSIDDIIASIAQAVAIQPGTFILGFSAREALGSVIFAASSGAVPVDEFRQQLNWIQADLQTGTTLIVPRQFDHAGGVLRLVTETMVYRLRPYRSDGAAQWDIAVCFSVEPRSEARWGQSDDHSIAQPITAVGIPRAAEELRARLGPAVLDWGAFVTREPENTDRVDVRIRKGLLLVQIVEAVIKALDIYPIEVMDQHRRQGRRYAVIRAEPGNERDRYAKKIGLSESATALRRLFEDDGRDADAPWRISQAASLGASQQSDVSAAFIDVAYVQGRYGYLFEIDEELPDAGPYFLRAERDTGTERVIARRLANIKALDTRLDLAQMLDDPWRMRRSSRETINENDENDSYLQDLDPSKRKALLSLWSTLPSFFVVGPPGVGKTRLATETVRRRFEQDRSTRMLISAQGHDALDHLQEKITDALRQAKLDDVIVVRSTTPDRRQSSDEEVHLLGLDYLEGMSRSRLMDDAPLPLKDKVKALKHAAQQTVRDQVSREERSGLHAISSLLLDGANIVISTTNSPDVERLVEAREQFDWVVVEEAAKATGPELIGPLMLSGRRLLIGDHNQLAPFGAERIAAVLKDHSAVRECLTLAEQLIAPLLRDGELEELTRLAANEDELREVAGTAFRLLELFQSVVVDDERRALQSTAHRPIAATLTQQRRMDPAIARIISHAFYGNKLETYGKRAREAETELPPFVDLNPLPPSPVVVVDFKHVSSSGAGANFERGRPRWHNPSELDSVIDVLRHVRARPSKKKPTLAILAPYKAQVDKLHGRVKSLLDTELAHLEAFAPVRPGNPFVGTVDSFQGSEADLVIISLVRNNPRTGFSALGFLRDKRRMNVALSRAKSQLVIVGSLKFLREAVRGVNPDEEKHSLSFLTRVVEAIDALTGEKREARGGIQLATLIAPDVLKGRK